MPVVVYRSYGMSRGVSWRRWTTKTHFPRYPGKTGQVSVQRRPRASVFIVFILNIFSYRKSHENPEII